MYFALKQLFLDTIFDPAKAGKTVLGFKLSAQEAWFTLALASALNALAFFATLMVFPPSENTPLVLEWMGPLQAATVIFVVMSGSTFMLHWAAKVVGGAGTFTEMLGAVAWLQIMRFALQILGFLLMVFVPGIANLLTLMAGLYGIWIMANFMNVIQGYDSLGRAAMALVLSFVGLVVVLSIAAAMLGLNTAG